jgi:hypothetical protein
VDETGQPAKGGHYFRFSNPLAEKGETKKKRQVGLSVKRAAEPKLLFSRTNTRLTNLPSLFERGSAAGELPIAYFPPRFD